MHREDFSMLDGNLIYFDNGATTLKPKVIMEPIHEYYNTYTASAHRGDYDNSLIVDTNYEEVRTLVKDFIGASSEKEIVYTSGTTDSINKIVFGFFKNYLVKGDEVLLTKSEHASNVLPWFLLQKEIGIKVNFIELDNDHKVTLDNVRKSINSNTKVISIAHVTNVIGDVRDIKSITNLAHQNNILVLVDGAQSVPHIKVDVVDADIDFMAFSAHKMCGPTGVGILYGKKDLLDKTTPIIVGGGMNNFFDIDGSYEFRETPNKFEAGTPNIEGVIAFGRIIKYLNSIGISNIYNYELELREYAVNKLKEIENIVIYNSNSDSGVIAFNYKDIFAQDLAIYLNKYRICVRAGNHCAKILKEELGVKNTCRISLYFYNTKEEVDYLVKVLTNSNIKEELF
ncbi:MAG: cysteine desulfurase [Bacilli bacterium]|nr:cysteine desulfurase [Bacilli bacterium]